MPTRPAEPGGDVRTSPSGPAAERRRIVASKLAAPPLRPGIVDRPVLVDTLVSTTHAPVVLISAPAGYGKTTLLALWRQRDHRPFAWVSLNPADNDPAALVASVLAALDPILNLGPSIMDTLAVPAPPLEDVVLPSLVDACAAGGQTFVLVLDDLQLVTAARSHTVMAISASGCRSVVSSRWGRGRILRNHSGAGARTGNSLSCAQPSSRSTRPKTVRVGSQE
jgi:ATP/maltotriose-dependent transcriptional regulator MalT